MVRVLMLTPDKSKQYLKHDDQTDSHGIRIVINE